MILEARKSSEYKSLQRKNAKKKRKKEKEKASRKSQKLLKPRGKSKKPITLKTKRQGQIKRIPRL